MKFNFLSLSLLFLLFSCTPEGPSEEKETPEPEPTVKYYQQPKGLTTQAEIDAFAEQEYNVIVGNFLIMGETITDISGLSTLTSVRGDMQILATGLKNLDGLENIDLEDGSSLSVTNNNKLTDIRGLKGVSAELHILEVRGSSDLKNLSGLEGITGVTYQLEVRDLETLNDVDALSNIKSPVKYVYFNTTGVTNTNGLANIPEAQSFSLTSNPNLTSLNLSGLKKIERFFIDRNESLENIDGLLGLEEAKTFIFQYNISLKNMDGLENLKITEDMTPAIAISGSTSLDDYCGLQSLAASGWTGLTLRDNLYNPTIEQIATGECSL